MPRKRLPPKMYQSSQSYTAAPMPSFGHGGGSRLEYIAHSEVSCTSTRESPGYGPSLVSSRLPNDQGRVISYKADSIANTVSYNLNTSFTHFTHLGMQRYHDSPARSSYASANQAQYQLQQIQPEYHFDPALFLKPGKEGGFVGKAEEVRSFVEAAFERIFNVPFPHDIKISVLPLEEFRQLAPQPGVIGLSLNRTKQGLLNEIFILNDSLARVMLTIGHELGHVLTETLGNPHDEEAKAYAFSLEWMKVIKEYDIAGLGEAIVTERPAENGLHNVAFGFVEKMLKLGRKAWQIYIELIKGFLQVKVPASEW